MKFQQKLQKFMYGRYGPDELYMFLFKIYIIVAILNLFIKSYIISTLEIIIIVITFYRFFSKKIYKRSNENQKFLKIKKRFKNIFSNKKTKYKGDNVYKKCKKCGITLKLPLPYERGIKYARCPKCNKRIRMLILKKQKVEIVK